MPKIYLMYAYNIKEGKGSEFQAYLKSKRFKSLCAAYEKETGIKDVDTYTVCLPSSSEQG